MNTSTMKALAQLGALVEEKKTISPVQTKNSVPPAVQPNFAEQVSSCFDAAKQELTPAKPLWA